MKTISHRELIQKIADLKGAAIVGLQTLTNAKARKTGNPHGIILKQARSVVMIGANYQKSVNRQGVREGNESAGEFVAEPLPWGRWYIPGKLIENKGKIYLRTQTTPGQRKIRPSIVRYRDIRGLFLSREEVKPFLPEKSPSQRQVNFGNEGEIQVRTIALENILRIRIGGETFRVE